MADTAGASVRPGAVVGGARLEAVSVLGADVTVREAARAMNERGTTAVIVAAPDAVSILTEHDVLQAVVSDRLDAPAVDLATPHPIAVRSSMSVIDALAVMARRHIGHLIVVDGGVRMCGILGASGALDALLGEHEGSEWLGAFRVALRLESEVPMVGPG